MKFLDLHYTFDTLRDDINAALAEVLESGWYLQGARTRAFEAEFAAFVGADQAVGVSNGLDALVAILEAMGIGPGDEVIVPGHTFIATWLAVSRTGATPVPVDADPVTMNLDLGQVAAAITPRTRAVMPVHLYGLMVDMQALRALLAGTGIRIIEDAAQAHGALRDGLRAGSAGDAAGFSFYPGKNLGAFGDAGAVTSSDADLIAHVRALINYGAVEKYRHDFAGLNARIDEMQAALLSVKLKALAGWTTRRRAIAEAYLDGLSDVEGVTLPVVDAEAAAHVWHLFVIRHDDRDALAARLAERGVPTLIHYPIANHHAGAYRADFAGLSLPVTEEICRTCLSLPIGPHLGDDAVAQVIEAVRATAGGR